VELDGLDEDPEVLPRRVTRAAFRVAILAADNAVRHAQPSRIELGLEVRGGALALRVVDDGLAVDRRAVGRSPGSDRPPGGRGLVDMRAAAADVGASFEARPSAHGTTVEFRWSPQISGILSDVGNSM
jgi:signal transduction histidine kinase